MKMPTAEMLDMATAHAKQRRSTKIRDAGKRNAHSVAIALIAHHVREWVDQCTDLLTVKDDLASAPTQEHADALAKLARELCRQMAKQAVAEAQGVSKVWEDHYVGVIPTRPKTSEIIHRFSVEFGDASKGPDELAQDFYAFLATPQNYRPELGLLDKVTFATVEDAE